MTIRTPFTTLFNIEHPIVSAPMGGVAGGALAAAVSNSGALGLVGGGYGDLDWLRRELTIVREATRKPWGVGVITWHANEAAVDLALSFEPPVFFLSFGDPRPYARRIKAKGVKLVCQVQDLASARLALEAGADALVAHGAEGGGHGATRGAMPLVPAVVDLAGKTPVLAAGGIADGRGLAAALMLGAAGALIGTRFYATIEAIGEAQAKRALVEASGDDTLRTRVFDMARNYDWPMQYTGRAINNEFSERWHGRENALQAQLPAEQARYQAAATVGNYDVKMVWASEAIDLICEVEPAANIVARVAAEAEALLKRAASVCAS
jgi:nitronate monooxygenase